jgi:cytochrome c oxidase subunit 2
MRWVVIPLVFLVAADGFIDVRTHAVWVETKEMLPAADQVVRITGQQFLWTFTYPGRDGRLGTSDDFMVANELHVPVNENIVFDLEARDVLHSFSVPALRLKQDAVPGRTIRGWFKALVPGTYSIACSQICGVGHAGMGGKLVVQTKAEYEQWVASHEQYVAAQTQTH